MGNLQRGKSGKGKGREEREPDWCELRRRPSQSVSGCGRSFACISSALEGNEQLCQELLIFPGKFFLEAQFRYGLTLLQQHPSTSRARGGDGRTGLAKGNVLRFVIHIRPSPFARFGCLTRAKMLHIRSADWSLQNRHFDDFGN